jgi:outer membrane immunogenic protein
MGIKSLVNNLASAALVLSFCGAVSVSALAQGQNEQHAAPKNINFVKTNPFDKFDKDDKAEAEKAAAKKQSSSSNSWTGWYVGGYIGANLTRAAYNTSTVFSSTGYFTSTSVDAINTAGATRMKSNNFSGGVQGGYNYQRGNYLFGFESDFGSSRSRQFATATATYPCCSPSGFNISQTTSTKWMFTARPRAGYLYKNALFYGTGGLAVTDIHYGSSFVDNFAGANDTDFDKKIKAGWTGGGGIEYKFLKRWSAKAEYLFSDFGRTSTDNTGLTTASGTIAHPENPFTNSAYLKNHNLRFGINFHF